MFTLTETQLRAAFHRARLSPRPSGAVLFGIRGVTPVGAEAASLKAAHQLERTDLDYLHARCTLGYWKPGEGFAVFPASTVPTQRLVEGGVPKNGEGVNQLCLGLHRGYRKGKHRADSARWGHRALRMERAIPVQRTADDLDYDGNDRLEYETAYDNIHCGWVVDQHTASYSSAGCQVVVGGANPETGAWKDFAALIYGSPQIEFDYALFSGGEIARVAAAEAPEGLPIALRFGSQGDEVEALQTALGFKGFPTAGVDGDFGWRTLLSVFRFQKTVMGLAVPDGVAGEQTLAALGLSAAGRVADVSAAAAPVDGASALSEPQYTYSIVESDGGRFKHNYAKAKSGLKGEYYLGYQTTYEGDVGLSQYAPRLQPLGAHQYNPADYATHGIWAKLILPTATGESSLWFERLNTYDRAAFTFGFFQAAAHIPNDNFILLFKAMLARPEGKTWFPDLFLKTTPQGPRLFQVTAAGEVDLEFAEPRSPTNNEANLKRFMAYLNPTMTKVEPAELSVAARMCQWTREEPACRALQVEQAVKGLRARMRLVATELTGRPVDQCIMAADILYQGRAKLVPVVAALAAAKPYEALLKLGRDKHAARIDTVDAAIKALMKEKPIADLRFDPNSQTLFR